MSDFWLGISNMKTKHFKKTIFEQLMPIASHPKNGRIFACQKMRKKQNSSLLNYDFVYNLRVLEHFGTEYSSEFFVNIQSF